MNIRIYAVITKMGKPSTRIWKNIQPGSEYMFSFLSFPNIYILWLCRPNILNFYALFWTTWLASTEKQSWVGLSHFWKTYTLYLFAICDTDLRSPCHIFGRLTRAEIRLRDQEERKYRCGRKIKTQSDIFCKHRQNRKGDCFLPRNQIKTSKIVTFPKACQWRRSKNENEHLSDALSVPPSMRGKSMYGVWEEMMAVWKLDLHTIIHALIQRQEPINTKSFLSPTFTHKHFWHRNDLKILGDGVIFLGFVWRRLLIYNQAAAAAVLSQ